MRNRKIEIRIWVRVGLDVCQLQTDEVLVELQLPVVVAWVLR